MRYLCTPTTDLHELIGTDGETGFEYGPLSSALRNDEELVLESSHYLPILLVAKIQALLTGCLFIVETEETLQARTNFRLVLQ